MERPEEFNLLLNFCKTLVIKESSKLQAEKQTLELQMKSLKEQTEKELNEREKQLSSKEKEFESLQAQVAEFPLKLEPPWRRRSRKVRSVWD